MNHRIYQVLLLVLLGLCGILGYMVFSASRASNAAEASVEEHVAIEDARGVEEPRKSAVQTEPTELEVIKSFHELWYYSREKTWERNRWFGIKTMQNPMDMWITQEIIFETKPDFIIECGSHRGGSAAYLATILSQVNPEGRVISVDIEDRMGDAREIPIVRDKVDFIVGSSTASEVVSRIKEQVGGKKTMVLLDSDHSRHHVLNELNSYWELVHVGGYIIVQDTNLNGNPVVPSYGPGPKEAVDQFLAKNDHFEIDRDRERLLFTNCPAGYLKRTK